MIAPSALPRGGALIAAAPRHSYIALAATSLILLALPLQRAAAQRANAPTPPWRGFAAPTACIAARGDVHAWLDRAATAMGFDKLDGRAVRFAATDIILENYQGDRPYAPFFSVPGALDGWYDPATGVERVAETMGGVFGGSRSPVVASDANGTYVVTDTGLVPSPAARWSALQTRPLNAWAELADFRRDTTARVVARCVFRDSPREVVARRGVWGEERLYLDEQTGLPVGMTRTEPHYLWGQQQVAYVYSLWDRAAGNDGFRPQSAVRVTDGAVEIERIDGSWRILPRDSAPPQPPLPSAAMTPVVPVFLQPLPVDTERVGANEWVLHNRGYREAMTMVRDTVYLLDATQGDERARLDSSWVARIYPRHRAVVLVVTDLAWPHIAGMRFWVARGATVVSDWASRDFLQRVVNRRWTTDPDVLERARAAGRAPAFHFIGVADSLSLAGGSVRLYPIEGIASEGALMAYTTGDRVLWASDFVQSLSAPTEYAREVWQAARRHGLDPAIVAAEHIPPSPWSKLERLLSP